MKARNEAKERAKKALKEKDEVEKMMQKTQANIEKLYIEILEVPLVVEATMEEHVSKISKVMKIFRIRIEELQLHIVLGTSRGEREGRERTLMTTLENIKNP